MKQNKILILGGSSFVGKHLFEKLGTQKAVATYCNKPVETGIYFDALTMRLSDIIAPSENISHAVILIGDTNPETCADDPETSDLLNVQSIKTIIQDLRNMKIKPLFTSSEFIFNGEKGNYVESDPAVPILLYGKQKVEIEEFIQGACNEYVIVRLAKVFGSERGDRTLFTNWLDAFAEQKTIRCARDQIFSPVYVKDVVDSIIKLIENDCNGIFHVASHKPYSRLHLLEMLLENVREYFPAKINIIPCSIHDFNLKEKRPVNVSMKPDKVVAATGRQMTDVEHICKKIVNHYFGEKMVKLCISHAWI